MLLLLGLFISMVLVAQPAAGAPDELATVPAVVTRVIDGTSLDAQISANRVAVGYLGAESAPVNDPCYEQARQRNAELAGNQVLLESDPLYQGEQDRGRLLFYAYTLDGVSIDETLIREGLAYAARTDARRGQELAAIEDEARTDGRGCLWSS